jgi:hypothetical protein
MNKLLTTAVLLATTATAQAETADINFSSESVRFALAGPLSRAKTGLVGQYDAGVIYKQRGDNRNDPRDARLTLGHVGALATGDAGAKGLKMAAGLGGRVILADREDATGGAFALGGQFDVRMPGFERLGLSGYGYLAPTIVTFGEVEQYHEYALDLDFQIVRSASAYVGFRQVFVKTEDSGKGDADSEGHLGLRVNF